MSPELHESLPLPRFTTGKESSDNRPTSEAQKNRRVWSAQLLIRRILNNESKLFWYDVVFEAGTTDEISFTGTKTWGSLFFAFCPTNGTMMVWCWTYFNWFPLDRIVQNQKYSLSPIIVKDFENCTAVQIPKEATGTFLHLELPLLTLCRPKTVTNSGACLLYTSDAADE